MTIQVRRMVLVLSMLAPVAAMPQEAGPGSGPCPGCQRMGDPGHGGGRMAGGRMFDPNKVTIVAGEVSDVERIERGPHAGVHLKLAMGSETVDVHLGPDFYVDAQAVKVAKGDKVEVKGARMTMHGEPVIIAQEGHTGGEVLALRDANGAPLWRGRGPGRK